MASRSRAGSDIVTSRDRGSSFGDTKERSSSFRARSESGSYWTLPVGDPFKVVLAVDESDQAKATFEYYAKYVHKPNHELIIVHCIEVPYQPVQPIREDVASDIITSAKSGSRKVEMTYEHIMREKGMRGTIRANFGKPGEYVVDVANREEAHMVVMGTRGMGKLRRTILGSVSDYVIHHAHCPVLICRAQ